jgi:hypothetical protein
LRPTTRILIFKLNTCSYSPYVTSSLMREWICHLQLLLVLAGAVILRSESHRTHDHILQSQISDFPNLVSQVLIFISSGKRASRLTPQTLGFLFVTSYNSQGYMQDTFANHSTGMPALHILELYCRDNTASHSSSSVSLLSLCACMCTSSITVRQQLGKYVPMATNTHATMEELLEASFSMSSMLYQMKASN